MCLSLTAATVIVVTGAILAVTAVRALNLPSVDNKRDRNIYMMSNLHTDSTLPITPPLSPQNEAIDEPPYG